MLCRTHRVVHFAADRAVPVSSGSHHLAEALEQRVLLSGSSAAELLGTAPSVFVQNRGQWTDQSVRFVHQGSGASIGMTDSGAVFQLVKADLNSASDASSTCFSVRFDGASEVSPVGQDRAGSVFNYYLGKKNQWRTNVPGFESLVYSNLYKGIDLAASGEKSGLKYEFRVDPGADYHKIRLSYDGIQGLSIDSKGALHILTNLGEVIDQAPFAYQMINGRKVEVAARYQLVDGDTYRFQVTGKHDHSHALVIDPYLDWSSYLGGSKQDKGSAIATDSSGNAWVTGTTWTSGWASGGFDTSYNGGTYDAFVAKIGADGTLVWTSYLGGSSNDVGCGVAIGASGSAWVTGYTESDGWTSGGFDTSYGGNDDAFVAKINANGTLAWSSYLGGDGFDYGYAIATDPSGNAWVTGATGSDTWASGGFDTSFNGDGDVMVAKINANGTLAWTSYMGGVSGDEGKGIATDSSGNAWLTGTTWSDDWASGGFDTTHNGDNDVFVAKVNANGTLAWSSYMGGTGNDHGLAIDTDISGNAWVTGLTQSEDFADGGFDDTFNGDGGFWGDAFVAKINANGSFAWSSYLGGADDDWGNGIATDPWGNAWVVGNTASSDWTADGFDTTYNGGTSDVFVAKINADGSLAWSSYLGGTESDGDTGAITIDPWGNAWLTGQTSSPGWASLGFDTSYNNGDDAFVAKVLGEFATLVGGVLTVTGTAGNDTISLALKTTKLRVTRNGSTLSFTNSKVKSIYIDARDGNDAVTIGSGLIGAYALGGNSNDTLIGGTGNDSLTGAGGKDRLEGNTGDDNLNAGKHNDVVLGGDGNDRLYGFEGTDSLDGGAGTDRIYGGSENDTILGGNQNDTVYGEAGADLIDAGAHNDRIIGGAGQDNLSGGKGDDFFDSKDGEVDSLNGGAGTDSALTDAGDILTLVESRT